MYNTIKEFQKQLSKKEVVFLDSLINAYEKIKDINPYALEGKHPELYGKYLGCGYSRFVFSLNDKYVIKLARNYEQSENIKEFKLYEEVSSKLKHRLAKIYFMSPLGEYLIMERCSKNLCGYNCKYEKKFLRIKQILITVFEVYGLGDLHEENLFFDNFGKVKIVDYAWNSIERFLEEKKVV